MLWSFLLSEREPEVALSPALGPGRLSQGEETTFPGQISLRHLREDTYTFYQIPSTFEIRGKCVRVFQTLVLTQ